MNVCVTGTSRGIGKALVDYHLKRGDTVLGISRRNASKDIPNYRHASIDLSAKDNVELMQLFADNKFDIVYLNAGMNDRNTPQNTLESCNTHMRINFTVNALILQTLADGTKVCGISSFLGEIGSKQFPLYAASKAAFSNVLRSHAERLKVLLVYPGRVHTANNPARLLNEGVPFREPDEVAKRVCDVVLSDYISGKLLDLGRK